MTSKESMQAFTTQVILNMTKANHRIGYTLSAEHFEMDDEALLSLFKEEDLCHRDYSEEEILAHTQKLILYLPGVNWDSESIADSMFTSGWSVSKALCSLA